MTIDVLFPDGAINQQFRPELETLIRKAIFGKSELHPAPFIPRDTSKLSGEQWLITETTSFRLEGQHSASTHFLQAGHTVIFPARPEQTLH